MEHEGDYNAMNLKELLTWTVEKNASDLHLSADMPPMVANPMLMDGQRMTAPLPPPLLGGDVAAWQS